MNVRLVESPSPETGNLSPLDGDMVELSLLLPSWQAQALETAAHDQGLTAGQMMRWLVRSFVKSHNQG